MRIGSREFDFSRQTYVMGVLNVTPDSFSDGGLYLEPERALDRALQMQQEGASLIDLGGESSRPGAQAVSLAEERRRVIPIVKKLSPRLKVPLSLDTRKAAIAEEGIREGVSLINDISALRYDFRMAEVIAQSEVPCILMHMQGDPTMMQKEVRYLNVVSEVIHFLRQQLLIADQFGISRERILVDPGIGFGKRLEHNLEILRHLNDFAALECPIVIGASRKSFIRSILGRENPLDPAVQNGSLAIATLAAWNGASLIRAHEVRSTVEAIKTVEALRGRRSA